VIRPLLQDIRSKLEQNDFYLLFIIIFYLFILQNRPTSISPFFHHENFQIIERMHLNDWGDVSPT